MTKDVMISVRGLQFMEGQEEDDIETVQRGEYYERNGSRYLIFDEYLEGFHEPVKNILRFKDKEVALTKRGLLAVQMNFTEGKKNLTNYQTPYGTILIGLDTGSITCEEKQDVLTIEIDYTLEANYQYVADCHIVIEARNKGGERFDFFDEEKGESEEVYGS